MELIVYSDRLREGQEEIFEGEISTDFLGNDPEFQKTLHLSGKAYVTGDHLILKFQAQTAAKFCCSICNEPVWVPVRVTDFYHAENLKEISSVFNFSNLLREDLLLQLPLFAECNGNCPERERIKNFLKKPNSINQNAQFPFSDL